MSIRLINISLVLLACLNFGVAEATPQSREGIQSQVAKAKSLRENGAFREARKMYESLLPELRAQEPSIELGDTLIGLGQIANAEGHYQDAIVLAHEGAEVFHKLGSKNGEAKARNDAGFAYMNAGKYQEATRDLDLALELGRQGGVAVTPVFILNTLGSVYYYQAKYSEAFRAYDTALQDVEQHATESWAPYWRQHTLLNLATLYQRIGNDQRALAVYKQLEESTESVTQGYLGHLYANLGVLYRHLGDPQKALDAYRKAKRSYALEHDVDGELGVLKNTGIVLALNLGRLPDALTTFTTARALAIKSKNRREAMQALLYSAETLYRMGHLPEAKSQLETALSEATSLGTVEEQWKALYALGKIAEAQGQPAVAETEYGDAISRIESVRSKIQLSVLKSDFLADKRDVYDGIIRLLLTRNDVSAGFEYMERSRARVFQDRFYSGERPAVTMSLQSIKERIDAATVLVEFWIVPGTIAAVWITKDTQGIAKRDLAPTEMEVLSHMIAGLPETLGENWRAGLEKLNAFMPMGIVPLSDARYTHILIVPDGLLSLLPFELLSPGSAEPLLANHDVSYLPSAVLLLRATIDRSSQIQFPWRQQLLAFGDPVVAAQKGDLIASSEREDDGVLPGSGAEIAQIAHMSAGRSRVFTGPADRKQSFLEALHPAAALLHISTHAVTDMDNPERSRLLFSPGQAGEPNSYLFLKELYDLDLREVSIATLSACDTEKGKLVPGEGIQAFSRALLAAGSRSALTTLWRVDDQATAEFMQRFYFFLLKKHRTKAEALRLAKLEFLHSETRLSHPRYWAAFVLNGDGALPVPWFIPWQELLLPLPVIVLLALLFLRLRERVSQRRSGVTDSEIRTSAGS